MKATVNLTHLLLLLLGPLVVAGQDVRMEISAENLDSFTSVVQIDYAEMHLDIETGWFAANDDASEFVIFDKVGNIYTVTREGIKQQWSYVTQPAEQVFTVIDAKYFTGVPVILYALDGQAYVNQHQLDSANEYLALYSGSSPGEIVVEAIDVDGATQFLRFRFASDYEMTSLGKISFPEFSDEAPAMRVGRVAFPYLAISSLADNSLTVYEYPDAFAEETAKRYMLDDGPAVAGAFNGPSASHFIWGDPRSTRLNLLDLVSGQSSDFAALDGAYAQYILLTHDASAAIVVNLDFVAHVFAWDLKSGKRHYFGPYRECRRIPDNVILSADGKSLIIGCDSGLDIWQVPKEWEGSS